MAKEEQYRRPNRTGDTTQNQSPDTPMNNISPETDNFFGAGYAGGQDKGPDSPFPHQPSPKKAREITQGMSMVPNQAMEQPQQAKPVIGPDEVKKAREILEKYKKGKRTYEEKIVKNEKWWKMRHWDLLSNENNYDDPKPASGWLFNMIINKHADYMDAFPTSDILPREQGDIEEAHRLSSIIPVVMAQNDYKQVYSDEVWYKLKHGTGVYGIFWDGAKLNGLGDISIKCMDILGLFWEPGVTDIQKSQNLFSVELVDNTTLIANYPQCREQLKNTTDTLLKKYWYDDNIDTTGKSAVVDWYYKKRIGGKDTLQYVKFVDDIVLYATENETVRPTEMARVPITDEDGNAMYDQYGIAMTTDVEVESGPSMAERGLYDHAMYPFVFDRLFPEAGMPVGFGFVDVCKNAQTSIDIYNNAFEKNVQFVCSPRYIVRNDGGINEDEFMNPHNLLIHTDGNLGEDSIAPVNTPTFINSNYINILDQKIDEMKEVSGNRDVTTGGSTAGVTAASAIAAMQEASGKTSRDQIASTYDAHKEVVNFVIELIRQFYDMPRQFRILGTRGQMEFAQYSNEGLQPQYQGNEFGVDMGYRLPVFDIDVKCEKESAYTQLSQNELALQFYNNGFFNPQYTDQVLACMDMMEFQGKSAVVEKIQQNGGMYEQMIQMQQQMLQMAQLIDQLGAESGREFNLSDTMADKVMGNMGMSAPSGIDTTITNGGEESSITANARKQAADTTKPR